MFVKAPPRVVRGHPILSRRRPALGVMLRAASVGLSLWGGLSAGPARGAPARCVISGNGVVLDRVIVTPKDSAAFELRIDGAGVETVVPSEGRVSDIQVEGSISFGARVEDLRYVARKPIVAYGGLVRILQGAAIA